MNWDYIAGFWDGEGWVSTVQKTRWIYWMIGACQSTPQDECLKEIQKFLNEHGIQTKIYIAKSNGPRRKPISKLFITGDRENKIVFLKNLAPRCIVKRQKAEYALKMLIESPRIVVKGKLKEERLLKAYAVYETGESLKVSCKQFHLTAKSLRVYIKEKGLFQRTKGDSVWIARRRNAASAIQ